MAASRSAVGIYRHWVFYSRSAPWVICIAVFLVLTLLFVGSGILEQGVAIPAISSTMQLVGLLLLMVLMPVWLLLCLFVTQRHTLRLSRRLNADTRLGWDLEAAVTRLPHWQVSTGMLGGILYALAFNIPYEQAQGFFELDPPMTAMVIGQVFLWLCAGLVLSIRLYIASLFYRLGKTIELTIFEQSRLQPFAWVGMLDVLIVVGGLAIATVQSIDAQFRVANYLPAFLVAAPAAGILLVAPMWTLHRRLAGRKRELMQAVRQQLQEQAEVGAENTEDDAMGRMESLLQRRDRIEALNTWPIDVAIWSRLFFYGLIPPLAWFGAAFVEVLVERVLAG